MPFFCLLERIKSIKRRCYQMTDNPLLQLKVLGQSVWYDNIDRGQLLSGQFKRLLDEDGVSGVTANPTIFQKSISQGQAYDEQVTKLITSANRTRDIYEAV